MYEIFDEKDVDKEEVAVVEWQDESFMLDRSGSLSRTLIISFSSTKLLELDSTATNSAQSSSEAIILGRGGTMLVAQMKELSDSR